MQAIVFSLPATLATRVAAVDANLHHNYLSNLLAHLEFYLSRRVPAPFGLTLLSHAFPLHDISTINTTTTTTLPTANLDLSSSSKSLRMKKSVFSLQETQTRLLLLATETTRSLHDPSTTAALHDPQHKGVDVDSGIGLGVSKALREMQARYI